YREWFVNFCFPGHEGVRMVESEMGLVPDGWEVKKIETLCAKISDGDWIETKDQSGMDFRLLQVSNIGVGSFIETRNYRYISKETFDRLRCQEVLPGDILLSRMPTPTGRAWLVTKQQWKMITAVDVAILKTDPSLSNVQFLINYLNSPSQLDIVEKQTTGTTRPRITRSALSNIKLIVPPLEIQNNFGNLVENMYYISEKMRTINTNLRRTRDLLLPKLISGELDVSELDIEIPAV
ncbi:MAG: restriction endonuclease subunit S, partial [Methanoregula sp.]|nr:restriction endonuclease subunit S [Methanoregula sp.]